MLITSMYLWWFTNGWKKLVVTLFGKMSDALSFFSIGSLLRTLFAPFRQISAESDGGGNRLAAFGDRLVSRFVGAVVRLMLMLAGICVFIGEFIVFSVLIICWPIFPLLPIIGIVLAVNGVIF